MSSQFDLISDHSKEKLKEVPKDVLLITNLKMLFLEGNRLTSLPDNIFHRLPKLMWLDLRNNQLADFPKSVAYHTHLENLLLTNNKLEQLPNELGLVPNLKVLQVAENPLKYPVRKIVREGTKAIKKYLKQQYETTRAKSPVVFPAGEDKEKTEKEETVLRVIDEYSRQSLVPHGIGKDHENMQKRSSSFSRKKEHSPRDSKHSKHGSKHESRSHSQNIQIDPLELFLTSKEIQSERPKDNTTEINEVKSVVPDMNAEQKASVAAEIPLEVIKPAKKPAQDASQGPTRALESTLALVTGKTATGAKEKPRKVNERCQSPREVISRAQQEPPSVTTQQINTDDEQTIPKQPSARIAVPSQQFPGRAYKNKTNNVQKGVQSQMPPQLIKVFKMDNDSGESPGQMIKREFQMMKSRMRPSSPTERDRSSLPYNVVNQMADPRMLQPTVQVRKLTPPTKSREEACKIVHNIHKQGSRLSLKSYFSATGSKKAKVVQRNLKDGWLNKLRILLEDQERILQQERNLKALSSWRQKHQESTKASKQPSRAPSPPYATYPEYSRIPNRDELTRQLQAFLNQLNLPRSQRNDIPILNIEKLLIDMEEQLREMQNTHSVGTHSPRTEIDQAEKQIRAIMDIHKKLLDLKAANEYT